jgi:hypothetical protein
MTHYVSDPSVYIATIDCAAFPRHCHDLAIVDTYPAFVAFTKSRARILHPQHTKEALIAEVESLKRVDFSIQCSEFPVEFDGAYPYFVYESESQNSSQLCTRLEVMKRWFPELVTHFYFRSRSSHTRLTAVINDRMSFNHTGEFDIRDMVLFVKDYIMMPLDAWRIDDGLLSKRRFVFFVHNSSVDEFLDAAVEHIPEFLVGQLRYDAFHVLYPKVKLESPALIASNLNKTRFVVINGVNSIGRFNEVLREIGNLEWEDRMRLELPKLFPKLAPDGAEEGKKCSGWIVAVAAAVIVLVIGACLIGRRKTGRVWTGKEKKE